MTKPKQLKIVVLFAAPILAAGALGIGQWADRRERATFDDAEERCLFENYCKRVDCKPQGSGGYADLFRTSAQMKAWEDRQPRKYAIPSKVKEPELEPGDYRKFLGSSTDECQRPPTSDWDFRGILAAFAVALPWALVMGWLLVLYMIKSVGRAVRDSKRVG